MQGAQDRVGQEKDLEGKGDGKHEREPDCARIPLFNPHLPSIGVYRDGKMPSNSNFFNEGRHGCFAGAEEKMESKKTWELLVEMCLNPVHLDC